MIIKMFNFWYFFWLLLSAGAIVGLYFALRKASERTQKIVLFSILAVGFALNFLKVYIPPYSVDEARKLRDLWMNNICGANIFFFPFFFVMKNKKVKDYMFYIGIISGLIALFYPQEPLAKSNQLGEFWDIVRFYFHHWMLLAVPLLMVLLKLHTISYKRILVAPTGLLLLMLFIILNQIFQSELGYTPVRNGDMFDINHKNSSYIWGPGTNDAIGSFLAIFCPKFFKIIPVGQYAGQEKVWPWFWLIFPCYILVTPLAFGLSMIFDHANFVKDMKALKAKISEWNTQRKQKKVTAVALNEKVS
ncbi:MAG: hypothetical protein E7366_02965 [Clostridiales bacterium]|jgi:hypothetical protein|nr:hypothetical protein [Clostridiales bacterium]